MITPKFCIVSSIVDQRCWIIFEDGPKGIAAMDLIEKGENFEALSCIRRRNFMVDTTNFENCAVLEVRYKADPKVLAQHRIEVIASTEMCDVIQKLYGKN